MLNRLFKELAKEDAANRAGPQFKKALVYMQDFFLVLAVVDLVWNKDIAGSLINLIRALLIERLAVFILNYLAQYAKANKHFVWHDGPVTPRSDIFILRVAEEHLLFAHARKIKLKQVAKNLHLLSLFTAEHYSQLTRYPEHIIANTPPEYIAMVNWLAKQAKAIFANKVDVIMWSLRNGITKAVDLNYVEPCETDELLDRLLELMNHKQCNLGIRFTASERMSDAQTEKLIRLNIYREAANISPMILRMERRV